MADCDCGCGTKITDQGDTMNCVIHAASKAVVASACRQGVTFRLDYQPSYGDLRKGLIEVLTKQLDECRKRRGPRCIRNMNENVGLFYSYFDDLEFKMQDLTTNKYWHAIISCKFVHLRDISNRLHQVEERDKCGFICHYDGHATAIIREQGNYFVCVNSWGPENPHKKQLTRYGHYQQYDQNGEIENFILKEKAVVYKVHVQLTFSPYSPHGSSRGHSVRGRPHSPHGSFHGHSVRGRPHSPHGSYRGRAGDYGYME
jgi:hypothetical protein